MELDIYYADNAKPIIWLIRFEIISIGIDQGIASSGYGVIKGTENNIVQNMTLLDYGVIETASKNHMCNRTMVIVDSIKSLLKR